MRYLSISEILLIHRRLIKSSGGASEIRDLGALESAIAQPRATFDGKDLYASIEEKAAYLCFFIVRNHPFMDGNKRTGHAAMEIFLYLNGYKVNASVDEQEKIILELAAGVLDRAAFANWVYRHVTLWQD